jgi:hypothetical protein
MPISDMPEVRKQLQGIADARFNALREIDVNTLDFNPFLLRLMGFQTAREIAEFMVDQRTERSVVTSFGTRIQNVAKVISERGTGVEGADICKEKNGRRYYIQMKAGPNTVNKDIASEINTLLQSATRRNSGSVALLGMTYGRRDRVSSIIQKYSRIDWLIGKEFWEFISDNPGFARELFDIVADISDHYSPDGGVPYHQRYEHKVAELTDKIVEKYGASGTSMWDRIFEENM